MMSGIDKLIERTVKEIEWLETSITEKKTILASLMAQLEDN